MLRNKIKIFKHVSANVIEKQINEFFLQTQINSITKIIQSFNGNGIVISIFYDIPLLTDGE